MANLMFYNLNNIATMGRSFLENAVIKECELDFKEAAKLDDEQLRWMLIEKRHTSNGRTIEYHRKEEK